MKRGRFPSAALAVVVLLASGAAGAADLERGKQLFDKTCATCHGANASGDRSQGAPRLAGQRAYYLKRQLGNFRAGIRGTDERDVYGQIMRPNAVALPDAQAIDDVIAYIGTLRAPTPAATLEGDAAAGRTRYAPCQACHGPRGAGLPAMNAPGIAGQHDWYLVRQLENFKAGIRGADPRDQWGQQMAPMARTLPSGQAVRSVVAYIRSFKTAGP